MYKCGALVRAAAGGAGEEGVDIEGAADVCEFFLPLTCVVKEGWLVQTDAHNNVDPDRCVQCGDCTPN